MKGTRWTPAEVAVVTARYGREPARTIAQDLPGRTAWAVRKRAQALGLAAEGWQIGEPLPSAWMGWSRQGLRARSDVLKLDEAARLARLLPTELAYFAGLMDGEGTILVGARVRLSLTNTDGGMIDWLSAHLGGAVYAVLQRPGTKLSWEWTLNRRGYVLALLEAALPYLVTKRARALEALATRDGGEGLF